MKILKLIWIHLWQRLKSVVNYEEEWDDIKIKYFTFSNSYSNLFDLIIDFFKDKNIIFYHDNEYWDVKYLEELWFEKIWEIKSKEIKVSKRWLNRNNLDLNNEKEIMTIYDYWKTIMVKNKF